MTPTNGLLQLLDSCDQLFNGLLQSSYLILTALESGLLKAGKPLKFNNVSFQLLVFIGPLIDAFLGCLPLIGKTTIVQQHCLFDGVGNDLEIFVILFVFLVNLGDLCTMGLPLSFSIIHL